MDAGFLLSGWAPVGVRGTIWRNRIQRLNTFARTNGHPHRFRHSFAINNLRNGGDLLTLQDLLSHSDIAMVKRYAHIVQADCARAHQKASPVDNWKL